MLNTINTQRDAEKTERPLKCSAKNGPAQSFIWCGQMQ